MVNIAFSAHKSTLNNGESMKKPLFQTERIICREFHRDYLQQFADYRALPEVARFQSWDGYCYQDALDLFRKMSEVTFATVEHWFQLALHTLDSQTMIGDLAVHFIDGKQMEIGFTLAPVFQGQGYAREAVSGILDFLFEELSAHRVIAITDTENVPAWTLLENLGFRQEGHFVENIYFKGSWGSEFQYAILADEWCKQRPTKSRRLKELQGPLSSATPK